MNKKIGMSEKGGKKKKGEESGYERGEGERE